MLTLFVSFSLAVNIPQGRHDALALAADVSPTDDPRVDFGRDVRPIFKRRCYRCHGSKKQQAGLRLDDREATFAGGDSGPALVPGDAAASDLIARVSSADPELRMPPKGPRLSSQEIKLLRKWIDQGARWPQDQATSARSSSEHWAYQPLRPAAPPAVTQDEWVVQPLDRFILARLESAKLSPSASADRATLIRRATLDVTGLLPTVDQVETFVADPRPDVYGRLVDRLLESPHYGERWGAHWLDVARYADSNGFTIDSSRSIWKYRDWVIDALNRDLPFDQFTIEQIAGDLLENPSVEQIVATGFHRNTLINEEGGTDDEQFRVESIVDRVNTTGAVWLGLTVGCAQCHSHKYDQLTQREYYQLYAFFNNADEPTIRVVPQPRLAERKQLEAAVGEAEEALAAYDRALGKNLSEWEAQFKGKLPLAWSIVQSEAAHSAAGASLETLSDGSLLAGGTLAAKDTYTISARTNLRQISALRVEVLKDETLPAGGPGRAHHGNFMLTEIELEIGGKAVSWQRAYADDEMRGRDAKAAIDGKPDSGWSLDLSEGRLPEASQGGFVIAGGPVSAPEGGQLTIRLRQEGLPKQLLGRFRLSVSDGDSLAVGATFAVQRALAVDADSRSDYEREVLRAAQRESDPSRAAPVKTVNAAKKELDTFLAAFPNSMVMRERREPRQTHIHIRGNFLRKGDQVSPGVPGVLPPLEQSGRPLNRLDLARWLVRTDQPLTARVIVNRIWQRYFGIGLVETENDFGVQGTPPSHPALLDWLAGEFMRGGWSLKRFHRMILTSATYRQSSHARPDAAALDPKNLLLARQNRIRLDAEVIRDAVLSASGLLVQQIGGAGVYPPQPSGIYKFTQNDKKWRDSTGRDRYRRGMYTFYWRSSPHPFLTTFDKPKRVLTCTRRVRSNTPLQALTLANDRGIFEVVRAMGRRILEETPTATTEERIAYAFRICTGRIAKPEELQSLQRFWSTQRAEFEHDLEAASRVIGAAVEAPADSTPSRDRSAPSEAAELAAWTSLARVLVNLDEFITRE